MTQTLEATAVFCGHDRGLLVNAMIQHEGGLITAVSEGVAAIPGGRRLVIPALVNAHDHARPSMSSFGASNLPLETWIVRSAFGTPPDPYLAAAIALGRSARAGCGAMMVHYTRPSGTMPMLDEARAIARGRRRRHPARLRPGGTRPEPAGLWRQCSDLGRYAGACAADSRGILHPAAHAALRLSRPR